MDERFKLALESSLEFLRTDPEVRIVQLYGSVQRKQTHAHSDIDLYAVTSRSAYWRSCVVRHGVPVEAIFGPEHGIRRQLVTGDVSAVKAFATGETLMDRDGAAPALIALARKVHEEGPPALKPSQRMMTRAVLTRFLDKLRQLPDASPEARMVAGEALPMTVVAFYDHHRLWKPSTQHRLAEIERVDPHVGRLLRSCYTDDVSTRHAVAVIQRVLEALGGELLEYQSEQVPAPARPAGAPRSAE